MATSAGRAGWIPTTPGRGHGQVVEYLPGGPTKAVGKLPSLVPNLVEKWPLRVESSSK